MKQNNIEIRELIKKKRLQRVEVAEAWSVFPTTVSHLLRDELPPDRKKVLLKKLRQYKPM